MNLCDFLYSVRYANRYTIIINVLFFKSNPNNARDSGGKIWALCQKYTMLPFCENHRQKTAFIPANIYGFLCKMFDFPEGNPNAGTLKIQIIEAVSLGI